MSKKEWGRDFRGDSHKEVKRSVLSGGPNNTRLVPTGTVAYIWKCESSLA